MSEMVTVAILLATYNGEKYISTQIDSILAQDYTNWKIFVSDDGSKDGTMKIVKEYVNRFPEKIVILEKEKPTGSAKKNFMYMASAASEYDYIMCCDQDDYWMPDKIRLTLEKMQELEAGNTQIPCLVHTDLEVVDGELKPIAPSFFAFSNLDDKRCNTHQLLIQNIVTGCTMMVNKALLKYAAKPCDVNQILMHDYWYALIAASMGRIGFVNRATIRYRQHGNNSVGAKNSRDVSYIAGQVKKGNKNRVAMEDTMVQAKEFVKVFAEELSTEQKELIEGYAKILDKGKFRRIIYMCQKGIWKKGITRKVAQIIYI